jgi:DUF438 domain-containing protein
MSDEAPTQADLFLEHAMRDAAVLDSIKSGKWADIEAVAKSLNYNFTKAEFTEAAQEVMEDELEDEQLEKISGGISDEDWADFGLELFSTLAG